MYQEIRFNHLNDILTSDQYKDLIDSETFVKLVKCQPRRLANYLVAAYLKRRSKLFERR